MAFIAFDDEVSGSGEASWATSGTLFIGVDVLGWGMNVREVDDEDHFIRAGWISLGDEFDIGEGTHQYWNPPMHVNFEHSRFTPNPSYDQNGTLYTWIGSRIRWHFALGVTAHIYVFNF